MQGVYKNGNYTVNIDLDTGTKIRYNSFDTLKPEFAESIDITITKKCDGHCPYCYLNCDEDGEHADLFKYRELFDSFHMFQEVAINGNDLSHPQLTDFLDYMKQKSVIVNLTVNQIHFLRNYALLGRWMEQKLISGLGLSLMKVDEPLIRLIESFPKNERLVIHVINGIFSEGTFKNLSNLSDILKILILGYKESGRGSIYKNFTEDGVAYNQKWLKANIREVIDTFQSVSFDTLATEQLDLKSIVPSAFWKERFMGNDGEYTFYLDLVEDEFAVSSNSKEHFKINGETNVDRLFQDVQKILKSA